MPWSTICFGSALHGLPSPVAIVFNCSERRIRPIRNSRNSCSLKLGSGTWGLGQLNPPMPYSRYAHHDFPKGPRHNPYRNDREEHHFQSAPSHSSHALCRRGALYITSHRGSLWDYDLTRPSRLQSNAVNIIYRVNRISSTTAPHCVAPLRCLSRES